MSQRVVTIAEHYAGMGVNVDELQAQLKRALKCVQDQDADINKLHNQVAELRTIKRLGLLEELAEWRRGARRVFWRNRWMHPTFGHTFVDDVSLPRARARKRSLGATLTRVTVKPKGAK